MPADARHGSHLRSGRHVPGTSARGFRDEGQKRVSAQQPASPLDKHPVAAAAATNASVLMPHLPVARQTGRDQWRETPQQPAARADLRRDSARRHAMRPMARRRPCARGRVDAHAAAAASNTHSCCQQAASSVATTPTLSALAAEERIATPRSLRTTLRSTDRNLSAC